MLRMRFRLISIALLSLTLSHAWISPSSADARRLSNNEEPGPAVLSARQLASADLSPTLSPSPVRTTTLVAAPGEQSADLTIAQQIGRLFDYPALVLLAIAIICMAALSRRGAEAGLKEGNG